MSHIRIVAGGTRARGRELNVTALADMAYSITNEADIFSRDNPLLGEFLGSKRTLFVVSPTVYRLYRDKIHRYLESHLPASQYRVSVTSTAEANKSFATMLAICEQAKEFNLDRDGLFVAVGGGITLDVVGFAASIYRRGTKYIKIPTTLVGQVDVAVGVKTGINFQNSKNMLGTYYPAYATLNDPLFLKTLPVRELRCGMAEIIKMGLVCDADLFARIEQSYRGGNNPDIQEMDYEIFVQAMVRMIEELQPNLLEVGLERLVDFGHTFSMRFETHSAHRYEHGEAVAMDMALTCCISQLMGFINDKDCSRVIGLLKSVGLPIYDPACCTVENLQASIQEVCLHRNAVNLVVPTSIGRGCFIKDPAELPESLLQEALEQLIHYQQQDRAGTGPVEEFVY